MPVRVTGKFGMRGRGDVPPYSIEWSARDEDILSGCSFTCSENGIYDGVIEIKIKITGTYLDRFYRLN